MKLISINVNGIRSYYNKEALRDLTEVYNPDVLCIQETKASEDIVEDLLDQYDYVAVANSNKQKGGYAGVCTAIKKNYLLNHPEIKSEVVDIMPDEYYTTGRIVLTEFDNFILINVYTLNSGGKEELRERWNTEFSAFLSTLEKPFIITGDLNVVATELDYWGNYEGAIDSGPGLYEFEINHFSDMTKQFSLIDSFRVLHPNEKRFSWFSYRSNARDRNAGWRLDYFLVSKSLMDLVKDSVVHSEFTGSDHSPIELTLNY